MYVNSLYIYLIELWLLLNRSDHYLIINDPYLCHIDIAGFSCGQVSLKTLHYRSLFLCFNHKFPLLLEYQI